MNSPSRFKLQSTRDAYGNQLDELFRAVEEDSQPFTDVTQFGRVADNRHWNIGGHTVTFYSAIVRLPGPRSRDFTWHNGSDAAAWCRAHILSAGRSNYPERLDYVLRGEDETVITGFRCSDGTEAWIYMYSERVNLGLFYTGASIFFTSENQDQGYDFGWKTATWTLNGGSEVRCHFADKDLDNGLAWAWLW